MGPSTPQQSFKRTTNYVAALRWPPSAPVPGNCTPTVSLGLPLPRPLWGRVRSSLASVESTRLTSSLTSVPPQTTRHSLTHSYPGQLQPWFFASSRLLPRVSLFLHDCPQNSRRHIHSLPESSSCPSQAAVPTVSATPVASGPRVSSRLAEPPALLWFPRTPASG